MFVKKRLTGFVVLLVLTVVMTTLGSPNVFAESSVVTQPMETVRATEVKVNDDYFDPKVITIQSGKTTSMLLKNEGKREHTFTVEKLGIDVELRPGEEKTIVVKPNKPGTYELKCRYHFQEGMVGKVIIE